MSDRVLEGIQLVRRFETPEKTVEVLDNADISVAAGEIVGIVGASGVGKSTLLQILGSLDRPDSGKVLIGGHDVAAMSGSALDRLRNEMLGFVFQFHFLMPDFTAAENVMMPQLVAGVNAAEAEKRAVYWLDKVGLSGRISHRPGELSGGEQQRVAVARSLVNDPAVVFADEPTGNLDDQTGDEVHQLIRTLSREEGKTFVVVTHKRDFSDYADRVMLLENRTLQPLTVETS